MSFTWMMIVATSGHFFTTEDRLVSQSWCHAQKHQGRPGAALKEVMIKAHRTITSGQTLMMTRCRPPPGSVRTLRS
jgi:hypothetical protein